MAAVAVTAAACSGRAARLQPVGSGGARVKGGTATVALPAGVTLNWIFPFYAITNASVYNSSSSSG